MATIELLIAFAILLINITSVVLLVQGGQNISLSSEISTEATTRAKTMLELAHIQADQNFNSVTTKHTTEMSGPLTFNKDLTVTNVDDFTKEVKAKVSWVVGGKILDVTLSTLLANKAGDTCNPDTSGDWRKPQPYGYADFSSSTGATGIDTKGTKVYVTSDPSSDITNDFYIVDASGASPSDPELPILGQFSTTYGLTDVRTIGNYAYVTANSAAFQFLVIDITSPGSLSPSSIKAKRDMVTGSGNTAYGNTIFYTNKKVYIGLTKSSGGAEFFIFDVSNPTNPTQVGSYELDTTVNDIIVKNNIAYLATAAAIAPSTPNQLIALNVSDPANILPLTAYNSITLTGQSLALDSNNLYLGRTGGNGNPKLLRFNKSNLAAPTGTMDMDTQSGVFSEVLRSNLLFLTNAKPNDGFQIWDISSFPPTRYDTTNYDPEQEPTAGSDCVGNLIYIGQRSNKALRIIGPKTDAPSVSLSIHNSSHSDITSTGVNSIIHASATVSGTSGTPTGEVDFTFYTNNSCSGTGTPDPSNSFYLDGTGKVDPSSPQGPLAAGSYSFKAHYKGDDNYSPADSSCKSLSVVGTTPSITTTIYNATTGQPISGSPPSVPGGTVVFDSAEVTGSAGTPTGTVSFILYLNKVDCSGGNTTVYNNIPLVAGVAKTPSYTTVSNKSISYKATYNGDTNYTPITAACEPLTVN